MDMKMDARKDLHVIIPMPVHRALEREARRQGARTAQIMRKAVEEYLRRAEAERIAEEMREYVERMAPQSRKLVGQTTAHAARKLLEETEW